MWYVYFGGVDVRRLAKMSNRIAEWGLIISGNKSNKSIEFDKHFYVWLHFRFRLEKRKQKCNHTSWTNAMYLVKCGGIQAEHSATS